MTPSTSLPPTRQFLTSLVNNLTSSLSTPTAPQQQANEPYDSAAPSNPLKSLSQGQKALLSTLHVLFPPPMLLMALDLLDRECIVRVVERDEKAAASVGFAATREGEVHGSQEKQQEKQQAGDGAGEHTRTLYPPQAHIRLPCSSSSPQNVKDASHDEKKRARNAIYLVRSSQHTKSRFSTTSASGGGTGGTGTLYTVRLNAWNCTCAAFAFSCFPRSSYYPSLAAPWDISEEDEDEEFPVRSQQGREEESKWEFGGLSLDGKGGEGGEGHVPVCKHVLACLLGDRWENVLGSYIKERVVGREEMAGYAAEG